MNDSLISCENFFQAAKEFAEKSIKLCDGWKLYEDQKEFYKSYVKKETYMEYEVNHESILLKVEYVIFYNLSYGVPSFSFNVWNSSGALLSLEDIRKMSLIKINEKEFYSVITQQEHPIFQRPYFMVHPCHTEAVLSTLIDKSNNIIVTFLGLITPLVKIDLQFEYGL